MEALAKSWQNPRGAVNIFGMLLKGWYYRMTCRIRGQRVRFGKNFRVAGPLDIRGPGTVVFGNDCTVLATRLTPVTPYTHSTHAVIEIGHRVVLNGTRLGCAQHITIGENSVLADTRVFDTDYHDVENGNRHRWHTSGTTKPINIGSDVWIGAGAMILKGVAIGAHAVVGAGAVVTRDVPSWSVAAGNPARVIKHLKSSPYDAQVEM